MNTNTTPNALTVKPSKKVHIVKGITKLYFAGALTGSFIHIVTAAEKMGGHGVEAYATPFMIDGLAVMGMVMRSDDFSKRTNKIGFVLQCVTGSMSLAMNVMAANSLFGVLFGIALVACFILAEWLTDQIEGREVDTLDEAQAIVTAAQQRLIDEANAIAAKKAATNAKRQATRKRNLRTKKAQEKALESLVNAA